MLPNIVGNDYWSCNVEKIQHEKKARVEHLVAQGKVITLTITGVAEGMEDCVSTQGPR